MDDGLSERRRTRQLAQVQVFGNRQVTCVKVHTSALLELAGPALSHHQYLLDGTSSYTTSLLVAPNLMTLLGFMCIIANLATYVYYSGGDLSLSPTTAVPSWVFFSFAIGLFTYQSLDAIDGKQARRTGTSSPLGQLFDHGVDALNTSLGGILAVVALGIGGGDFWAAVFSLLMAFANFYLTTWEEFHTGTLYLGYFNGPVEGVLIIIACYCWTGIVGTSLRLGSNMGFIWND